MTNTMTIITTNIMTIITTVAIVGDDRHYNGRRWVAVRMGYIRYRGRPLDGTERGIEVKDEQRNLDVCGHVCRHVRRHVYELCPDMCIDMCPDMCIVK